MAKPLFKNYSFQFNKNEKKILISFCKTILKQMAADDRFTTELKTFQSIIQKIEESTDEVKFTKEEKTKLVFHLKENTKHMDTQLKKSGFIKRWIYKSVLSQYKNLLETHFTD